MARRRHLVFALALGAASLAAVISVSRMREDTPVTLGPPATLDLRLLGSTAEFIERHKAILDLGAGGLEGLSDGGTLYFQARASADEGPEGFIVKIENDRCDPFVLPVGRMASVRYVALWIRSVGAVLPMTPLSFERAREMAMNIDGRMATAGWERTFHRPDFGPDTIAEKLGSAHTLSRFRVCGQPGTSASVTVESYNDSPSGYSIPPTAVGDPLPDDAPARYLIRIDIRASDVLSDDVPDLKADVEALMDARRAAEGEGRALPLTVWLNDPDWRP